MEKMSELARKQISEGYSAPLKDIQTPTLHHRVGDIMWLRNKVARGEMPDTHMELLVKKQLEEYAAEREAQVRADEREKAKALVSIQALAQQDKQKGSE
jgi:hypothetical protein